MLFITPFMFSTYTKRIKNGALSLAAIQCMRARRQATFKGAGLAALWETPARIGRSAEYTLSERGWLDGIRNHNLLLSWPRFSRRHIFCSLASNDQVRSDQIRSDHPVRRTEEKRERESERERTQRDKGELSLGFHLLSSKTSKSTCSPPYRPENLEGANVL